MGWFAYDIGPSLFLSRRAHVTIASARYRTAVNVSVSDHEDYKP